MYHEEHNTETSINSMSVLKLHRIQKGEALLNFISDLIDTFQLSSLLGNSWVSLKPLKNHTVCTYMRSPPYLRYGSRSVDSLLPSATTYLFLGLVEPTTTTYIPTNLLYPFHAILENKRCELKTSIIRPSD